MFSSICFSQKDAAPSKLKAIFIFNFTKNFTWPNISTLKEFKIGVISKDEKLFNFLTQMAEVKKVGMLPMKVVRLDEKSALTDLQILYVDKYQYPDFKFKFSIKNLLLITDYDKNIESAMLSFFESNENIKFAINKTRINESRLKMSPKIEAMAARVYEGNGNKKDEFVVAEWSKSVDEALMMKLKSGKDITFSKDEAKALVDKYNSKDSVIIDKTAKLNSIESELAVKQKLLKEQQQKIDSQTKQFNLKSLEFEEMIKAKQTELQNKTQLLNNQNKAIELRELEFKKVDAEHKKSIAISEQTLAMHKVEIDKQQFILSNQEIELTKKKDEIAKQLGEINTQKSLLWMSGFVGVLIVSILVFVYRSNKQKQKANLLLEKQKHEIVEQKYLIEEKHKEITDSINYAERIQRSFLATKQLLDENLNEYFVLFKPKDIVSGDFYWAAKLHNEQFALVTADSTGHGVPGAIMSLLNVTSLETALKEGNTRPADILNSTRKTIIERLKKDGSPEGGKDGMDASLCIYDFERKKLTIAAANNPVWIVRNSGTEALEVLEVKPDKMPIGKHDKQDVSFTQQEFDLKAGDVVYTLTDGFPDQFGGPSGKKFMSKKLREMLTSIAHLPMPEQKHLLESTFTDWVGNMEQVDDVTLIGVRV